MNGSMRTLVTAAAVMVTTPGWAEGIAVGGRVSTLGVGFEVTKRMREDLNLRAGVNQYNYDRSGVEDGIDYRADLELSSGAVMVDWFPFRGGFRATGGVLLNRNELRMAASSSASYTIGSTTYTGAEVGSLTGKVSFDNTVSPYLGVGWGNAVGSKGNLSFGVDLGVVFQGDANVDLVADGLMAGDPTFQAELAEEEAQLRSSLDTLANYPVLSLGVGYRFK